MTKEELLELECQLSKPTDQKGIEVAKKMYDSNRIMILKAIDLLEITSNNSILEIGHGGCEHLSYIFKKTVNLIYTGLEVSETMQQLAIENSKNIIDNSTLNFELFDGENITYKNKFDRIFTVNTIYFWKQPKEFLINLAKALKSDGKCIIGFANKDFMKQLPFVKNKFKLYDIVDFQKLIENTPFCIEECVQDKEIVLSKTNEKVERERLFFILTKKNG